MSEQPDGRSPVSPHSPTRAVVAAPLTDAKAPPRRAGRPGRARRVAEPWAFTGSLVWALAGTLLPGLGLLKTRWRALGAVMLAGVALVAGVVGLLTLVGRDLLLTLTLSPGVLNVLWVALVVAGVAWVASIVLTHLTLRPTPPAGWQRLVGSLVVGVLSLTVAAPTFVVARGVYDTTSLIQGVFSEPGVAATPGSTPFGNPSDPWANKPRLNVLLLGGDNGQNRDEKLGARTDTVILASIDTKTGETVLLSLPRQTQRLPFPKGSKLAKVWPNGFTNGVDDDAEYFLNAIYDNVPAWAPGAFPAGTRDQGAEALKQSVGAALGLDVDFYAMINMDGFIELVNALGGITVNINRPVAVGGQTTGDIPPDRWLLPGPNRHLNGVDALWFARGRYGAVRSDYDRMQRQRCTIRAIVAQAEPTVVLANYEALTKAGRNILTSDVPNRTLPAMLTLAMRVRDKQMRSLSFENDVNGFSTTRPDWALVRQQVKDTLYPPAPAPVTAEPTPAATKGTPSATSTPKATTTPPPTATASAGPATPEAPYDECAYQPEVA